MVGVMSSDAGQTHHGLWTLGAGMYLFTCGVGVVLLLSDILGLFADVIRLPAPYFVVILPSPAFAIGAILWWQLIERKEHYSYLFGAFIGMLTAIGTGVLWTGRFLSVWGFEMLSLPVIGILTGIVLGITVIIGGIAGLPLMYARRRLEEERVAGDTSRQ